MKKAIVGVAAIGIIIASFGSVTVDAFAWDPFGIGKVFEAHDELKEAEKEADKAALECILLEGLDQCLLVCSNPIIDDPMACIDNIRQVNEELTK